jgi:hypothetical protein
VDLPGRAKGARGSLEIKTACGAFSFRHDIAGRKREGAAARTQYTGWWGREGFAVETPKVKTVLELDEFALEFAKRLPAAMNMSSQPGALTQDQLNALMNDPQLQELGGNLYIAKLFHYIVNLTHSGNDTKNATLQIDSDADFQLLMLMGTATSTSLSVQVTEGGAGGLAWQSAPVNFLNFVGSAQLPFPAGLIPQLMPKKRVYQITTIDSSGSANSVQIDFWGYKLYPAAQAAQLGAQPSSS